MKHYVIDLWDYKAIGPNNPTPVHFGQSIEIMAYSEDIWNICELMSDSIIIQGVKVYNLRAIPSEVDR